MRALHLYSLLIAASLMLVVTQCETNSGASGRLAAGWEARLGPVPATPITPEGILREVNLVQDMIKSGTAGRRYFRRMDVQYITIHATENPTGNAYQHALALKRGALRAPKRVGGNRIGFLTWHFTAQASAVLQHLPTNEQGEHADFDGPGNNHSIGIEMCEHHGNDLARTMDHTAMLAAYLMYEHRLPLSHVVPHYHWRRISVNPEHKPCPHFFMDGGQPGGGWRWFVGRVEAHYKRIVPGPVPRI